MMFPGLEPAQAQSRPASRQRELFEPCQLRQGAQDKEWVILEIPFPKAARFAGQAEKPFQAAPLHPARRLAHAPRMEVKRRTHPEEDRGVELWEILRHEFLLLGRAEPDPEQVRLETRHLARQ